MKKIVPRTEDTMGPSIAGLKKNTKPLKFYPKIRLEHEFFPETKKWEVGKEYTVSLKLKMTGLSIARYQNDSEFDIIGADMESKGEEESE